MFLVNFLVWAKDDCEKISDVDEKLDCYEKEKSDLTKSKNEFTKQLQEILKEKDKVNTQISGLSNQLSATTSQINQVDASLNKISKQIQEIEKNLLERKNSLNTKTDVRNSVLKSYYYLSSGSDLEYLIGQESSSLSNLTISLYAKEKINTSVVDTIKILSKEITDYESDRKVAQEAKTDLQKSYQSFLAIKNKLSSQKSNLSGTLNVLSSSQSKVEDKLDNIEASIRKLSGKQQAILAEKNGDNVSGSIGEYEQPDYSLPDPPYRPAFAMMSYGAFTHYNGMSQYGAKGRAEAGQDYTEILKYYYKVGVKKVSDFPSKISVKGVGELDYQYYLYGIAEMPSDWPIEALKSQAIAARTYAYRASKPICITEACQVFNASKARNVPSKWKEAVDATKGIILDNPKTSQYSSTTGGYLNNIGWDLKGGGWPGTAWEKIAGSPWFYKAWYTKGYASNSGTCGRTTPWLSEREMADILNSWVVWRKGDGDDKDRISTVVNNCFGGNPYSIDDMRKKAEEFGESYTSVTSVKVSQGNNGFTSSVTFSTNRGQVTIDGQVFKTVVNLRAPGYISFKSRLFDVEFK